ncbi:MAG: 50S ribosomal protein L10 [Saprospirales bacterium]|nr:MAG: 50S ribosomal protein L10 [Saprospirales bacterium]
MRKEQKVEIIEFLKDKFTNTPFFYLTDASKLSVEDVNKFRRACFDKGIEMKVVKNTLAKIAMESIENGDRYTPIFDSLKGPTAILFTDTANAPGKVLKEFRKTHDRPILKAAYIEESIYIGDEQIEALATLKSKEDLLGDVILLLQSPIKNVLSGLQSGGQTIAGLLKTLEERPA